MNVRPRRRRLSLLLLLAFVGTTSCARALDTPAAVGDELAQKFGECPHGGGDVDFAPPVAALAMVERWVEIDSIPSQVSIPDAASEGRTVEIALAVNEYDPATDTFPGNATKAPIAIHTSTLPGAAWAISQGGRVFVALASTGLEREMVAYTLVKPAVGSYFFAGECQFDSLTAPLRQSLGSRYDSVMEKIIGVTDANEMVALVEGPPPVGTASADIPTVLNPEDTSREVLDKLRRVTLALNIPARWTGPYTVCTKIAEGWNDCVALYGGRAETTLIDVYFNDEEQIDVWLLDENADLAHPLELLGTIDLSAVNEKVLAAKLGAVVRVGLRGAFEVSGDAGSIITGAEVRIEDAATWGRLLTDSARSLEVAGQDLSQSAESGTTPEIP
jgi:hypothetical protein